MVPARNRPPRQSRRCLTRCCPYYDRELATRSNASPRSSPSAHPKIAGRLRLSAGRSGRPACRTPAGRRGLPRRPRAPPARRRVPRTDRCPARTALSALSRARAVLHDRPVRLPAGPDDAGPPARRACRSTPSRCTASRCRYRTASAVTLWPVEVENVRLSGLPIVAPANPAAAGAVGVLRITLKCASPDATLCAARRRPAALLPARRRPTRRLPLYELLGAHTISIAYADSPTDPAPVIVPAAAIEPVGFAPEEALLPWSARSFVGLPAAHRILRLPGEVPVPRLHPDGHQDAAVRRQPAGDLRLSRPVAAGAGAHHRPAVAGARLHADGQPVSAALRADHAHPHGNRVPHRARRPAPARGGGLERRAGARDTPDGRSVRGGPFTG